MRRLKFYIHIGTYYKLSSRKSISNPGGFTHKMRVKKISSKVSGTKLWSRSELPQTVSSAVDNRYVNNWKILWTNNLFLSLLIYFSILLQSSSAEVYTNQFAVHVPAGEKRADEIAARHGFDNLGKIVEDHYHFVHSKMAKRSVEPHHEFHQLLSAEPEVRWHQQQLVKRRTKRDFLQIQPSLSSSSKSGRSRTVKRSRVASFNDPRWPAMWYLNRGPGLDMNVLEAWNEGITGKGIVVTILDDGLEKDHPDIVRNYDPLASFDVNSLDMDPMPTYDLTDSNRHGTRCAGEVAAEANNSICAVGVAFEASVGGVRMLDGDVTDAVEARSLSHNPQHIDIYSASWGPDDDGKTVDGPGELATRAFSEGVTKGRGGKGSIFVWASGNGGRDHDNCNCDGYTNSIWTLSISSATENGLVPWYSEACSSTLATTYSSGGTGEKQIVTIDLHHSCTSSHTGTSASAPLAAGICALALQANTNLTWRDMQHIVVRTARPQNLIANDWATNGVGRNVSHSFGYGLMDAGAMVKMAKSWKTVPEQNRCEVKAPYTEKNIPAKSKVTLDLKVTNCSGVNFLEHVQAKVTLTSGRRGDLQIYLVSPSGTRSTLLAHRRHDLNRAGFTDWPFMTVHCWGENPIGKWTLEIHNEGRYADHRNGRTVLKRWSLIAYGTDEDGNSSVGGGAGKAASSAKPASEPIPTVTSANGSGAGPIRYPAHIDLSYLKNPSSKVLSSAGSETNRSSVVVGSKGEASSESGRKPSRQRAKSKLVAKKQKGISLPGGGGVVTQKPAIRIVTQGPDHLGGGGANGLDGNKLFSKFANQSQVVVNESTRIPTTMATTMMRNVLGEKENSLNSSTSSSSSSLSSYASSFSSSRGLFGSANVLRTVGGNSSSTNSRDITGSRVGEANTSAVVVVDSSSSPALLSSATSPQSTRETGSRVISLLEASSSSNSHTSSATSSFSHKSSDENPSQGKLDTWTLVAHGLSHNPNDPPPAEGIGVAMPGAMMPGGLISSPTVAGGGAVPGSDSETGAKPAELHPPAVVPSSSSSLADPGTSLGHGSVVDLESSDNSIAIQPSHVHKGVDTVADIVVVPTASSSSSAACASVSSQGQCLDCSPQFALFHGICITECPETFYRDSQRQGSIQRTSVTTTGAGASASTSTSSYICLPCHYSCKTCRGPNEYDCLSCHNDANLHVMPGDESVFSRNESHCYPAVLLQSVNTNEFWYKTLLVTVIVNVLLVCLLLIYICFQRRSPVAGPSERRSSYRRVSPDDDQSTALDVGGYNAYGDYDEEEEDDSDAEDEAFTKLAPSNSQDEQRINFKNNLAAYVKSHNSVLPTSEYAADRRALLKNNSGLASSARTNSKNAV